jgi:hypothetical protein
MAHLLKTLEESLQDSVEEAQGNIKLGKFSLAHNEPLYDYISSQIIKEIEAKTITNKHFIPLQTFYSYFTKTFRQPIKIQYDNTKESDPITKEVVQNMYRDHKEQKHYDKRFQQYIKHATKQRDITADYEKNYNSYINYITSPQNNSQLPNSFFHKERNHTLLEESRESHTYITGASGYGKSETIKLLVHHYLTNDKNGSVILFDPHGDLSRELARFKENIGSENLVYINPKLDHTLIPKFNPFTLPNIEDKDILWDIVEDMSARFVEIMSEVFENNELREHMKTVLKNVFIVLCYKPNTDFVDILHLMDKSSGKKYIEYAKKHITDPITLLFLKKKLHSKSMDPTREAIKSRFFSLLQYSIFNNMTSGEGSFDLETLINQKKFIIFDFGEVSELPRNIFGKFLISQIRVIGKKRAELEKIDRIPCHVFIDECQLFITNSLKDVFQQLRKYKIYLTLAQQNVGDEMPQKLKKAVMTNAKLKIVGNNEAGDLKTMSENINVPVQELQTLGQGQFYIKSGNKIAVKVQMFDHLIEDKNCMSDEEWETVKQEQKQKYYRAITSKKIEEIEDEIDEEEDEIAIGDYVNTIDRKPKFSK